MTGQPKFLFVPVSGPGGAGEYFRSLAVARSLERRWRGCAIRFVVSRDAPYARDAPYPVSLVNRSPTYETREVRAILERERPDMVVFDSSGRVAQYRAARIASCTVSPDTNLEAAFHAKLQPVTSLCAQTALER